MSKLNGDKARYQKNRQHKMRQRERLRTLVTGLKKKTEEKASQAASLAMNDEGGPALAGD